MMLILTFTSYFQTIFQTLTVNLQYKKADEYQDMLLRSSHVGSHDIMTSNSVVYSKHQP